MAGGNLVGRVISYVVNELVVNSLANSQTFQRFAVRTSKRIEDVSDLAKKTSQKLAEQVEEMAKNADASRKR